MVRTCMHTTHVCTHIHICACKVIQTYIGAHGHGCMPEHALLVMHVWVRICVCKHTRKSPRWCQQYCARSSIHMQARRLGPVLYLGRGTINFEIYLKNNAEWLYQTFKWMDFQQQYVVSYIHTLHTYCVYPRYISGVCICMHAV